MLETVITSVVSYVGTNIDDIFIDALFFAQADSKRKIRAVVIGKYIGIGTLVLLSLLGACGLQFVPQKYIGLLGLIPIALGVREWVEYQTAMGAPGAEDHEDGPESSKVLVLQVAFVTMANGGDNIGVYIPLFAGYTMAQMIVVASVFAAMIALWCFLGKKLSDLPVLRTFLLKYKYVIVPVVLVALGLYILTGSGLFLLS